MGLITSQPEQVDVPFEPGQWVQLRALTGREMDEAQDARMERSARHMEAMAPVISQLPRDSRDSNQAPDDSIEARRQPYDPDTLIRYAVKGWSYAEPPSDDPARQIDARTRDWLWSVIVERNTRPPAPSPAGEPS